MGDDRIGIHVARMVQARLPQTPKIVFKELGVSGIRLVEELLGFDRVIIVDSQAGEETEVGRIRKLAPDDFADTMHPSAPHGMNFVTALQFYKKLEPEKFPKSIEIYTIGVESDLVFGDRLSPKVEKAGEVLVDLLIRELT